MKERQGGGAGAREGEGAAGGSAPGRRTLTEGLVRRKAEASSAPSPTGEAALAAASSMAGGGAPADPGVAGKVSAATGADVSAARIHTGPASQDAATALGARAYTIGQDVHFGPGQYQPGQADGDRLLAHELVHTVQQGSAGGVVQGKLEVSQPGDPAEAEADRLADVALAGKIGGAERPQATPAKIHRSLGLPPGTAPGSELDEATLEVQFHAGFAQLNAGDAAGALATFAGIYVNPGFAKSKRGQVTVRLNMGVCHHELGHFSEAISLAQEALGRPEVSAGDRQGLIDNIRFSRIAIEGGGGAPVASEQVLRQQFAAGRALMGAGQDAAALAVFQSIYANPGFAQIKGGQVSVRINIGVCEHRLGRLQAAIDMYQEMLSLPVVAQNDRQLGFDNMRLARLRLAESTGGPAPGPAASFAELKSRFLAGRALMDSDPAGALPIFMAVYSNPGYPAAQSGHVATEINIAVCHSRLGHLAEAISFFEDVLVRHDLTSADRLNALNGVRESRLRDAVQPATNTSVTENATAASQPVTGAAATENATAAAPLRGSLAGWTPSAASPSAQAPGPAQAQLAGVELETAHPTPHAGAPPHGEPSVNTLHVAARLDGGADHGPPGSGPATPSAGAHGRG